MRRPADSTRHSAPAPPDARPALQSSLAGVVLVALAACGGREGVRPASESAASSPSTAGSAAIQRDGAGADESAGMPRMLNAEPPFHYPPALWARQVQGNVVLRLFVDELGRVVPESTRVVEPSGYEALDSAAVRGSESLRFAPAMQDGKPVGAPMLFPVHFRHPQAKPLPGDTVAPPRP